MKAATVDVGSKVKQASKVRKTNEAFVRQEIALLPSLQESRARGPETVTPRH